MIDFAELSREERALYSPAFTAVAVTRAVQGYQAQYKRGCPITVAVLSVVMAMQPGIRRLLPATIRNGLTRWLEENQTIKIAMAQNAEGLAAVVRPGLLLALQVRVLQIDQAGLLRLNPGAITKAITADTEETLAIQKASYMLGRWLPSTGSLGTVMTLLGVRP